MKLILLLLFALCPMASGSVFNLTVADLHDGFGYDPKGSPPVQDPGGYFDANVDGAIRKYATFRFSPDAIGMRGLTLNGLTSLTYDTMNLRSDDWQLRVYTTLLPSGPHPFEHRLNFHANHPPGFDFFTHTLAADVDVESWDVGETPPFAGAHVVPVGSREENYDAALRSFGDEPIAYFEFIAGTEGGGRFAIASLDHVVVNGVSPEPGMSSVMGLVIALAGRPRH